MKAVKDWVSSQLVSSSLLQSRPLSGNGTFFGEGSSSEIQSSTAASLPASVNISSQPSIDSEGTQLSRNPDLPPSLLNQKRNDPLVKIEALQIKFMRLVHQLRQSPDNLLVAQVLYRLHLATLIRVGERDSVSRADTRAVAAQLEAAGSTESDFSVRILLLGKTGVGKSATINSIFNQLKVPTDAFQPATCHIQEVVGTTEGIKITFIDTPGLSPSSSRNVRDNRKILRSVKSFIRRRQQPDIVLYFERLDLINMGYSDLPLLKLITDTFGPAMWFNTILVTTHASGPLPEGPNGYLVNYDSFVSQCTRLLQHYIHQAAAYSKIENPVLLVENHPECKRNISGEKVLPNGQAWRSQFLLLCICTKVLGDANGLLKFRDGFQMGPSAMTRLPSLPHLLSTLLQQRSTERQVGEVDDDMEDEEEDDYDQLPPIRILSKAQFEKLSKSQRNDYLDELDYRETLYLKKQLKAENQSRRKSAVDDDEDGDQDTNPEAVQLPDIAVPQSFDSDSAGYRYRCLLTSDKWVARPVLDPQGWDHDVGFDGVNLETSLDLNTNLHASILGQVSKDKQDLSIQTESNVILTDLKGTSSISAGLDVQTAGKDLVCTSRGNIQVHNFKHNTTGCGVSLTSFGNKLFLGAKVEDRISIGKRVDFVVNAGRVGGVGQVAYGGNFETILKGRDYPVRNDKTSLSMTVLSFDKEIVLGGNIVSEFRVGRGSKISVNTNLNSRRMGQICIKTSSSDHLEIGAIALISILRAVFQRHVVKDTVEEED